MDPVNVQSKFEVYSFTRSWGNSRLLKTFGSPWICHSTSSKVVDFDINRKRVCDFLLVRHSNPGPILHRFGDTAGFLYSWVTPPLFHPNFWGVPVAPDRPCWGRPEQRLFGREIIFEVITVPQRHKQTHRIGHTHCGITALCVVSRGKNKNIRKLQSMTHLGEY